MGECQVNAITDSLINSLFTSEFFQLTRHSPTFWAPHVPALCRRPQRTQSGSSRRAFSLTTTRTVKWTSVSASSGFTRPMDCEASTRESRRVTSEYPRLSFTLWFTRHSRRSWWVTCSFFSLRETYFDNFSARAAPEEPRRGQNDSRFRRVHARRRHLKDDRFVHRLSAWSGAHKTARRRQQIQSLLADAVPGVEGRGQGGTLPRPGDSTRPTNSQHSDHDGYVWSCCLRVIDEVQRDILFGRSSQWQRQWENAVAER